MYTPLTWVRVFQYTGTLLASLTQLEIGIIMAFSAVLLPQLEADGVEVSPEHQSLLGEWTDGGLTPRAEQTDRTRGPAPPS